MVADLRFALRALATRPVFAVTVALTLALGIGSNVAIFSVVYAMLLRPLPFADPDRLVAIDAVAGADAGKLSAREVRALQQDTRAFSDIATFYPSQYNVTGDGPPESLVTMIGTANLFRVFGLRPVHGDSWPPTLDWTTQFTVMLSHGLWQRRYGSDPAIVGKSIRLDGADYAVTGVLPPGFDYPARTQLYRAVSGYTSPATRRFTVVARLAAGTTLAAAQVELDTASARFATDWADTNRGVRLRVRPLRDVYAGAARPYLLTVAAAVGLVLLIACANTSNLLLGRALSARSELAVKAALGARQGQLVRGLLAEVVWLTAGGGVVGVAAGIWGVDAFVRTLRLDLPWWLEIRADWAVAAFAVGVSAVAALLTSAFPALQVFSADVHAAIREGSQRSAGGTVAQKRARRWLVAAQVALAVTLLVGAGLLGRTVLKLLQVPPGFEPARVLTFRTDPPWTRYGSIEQVSEFYRRAGERLAQLPGVTAVATNQALPMGGLPDTTRTVEVEGASTAADAGERPFVNYQAIGPGYFTAAGIPLLAGRSFNDFDRVGTAPVTIVSERTASRLWPGQTPVGKRLSLTWRVNGTGNSVDQRVTLEVVGVVGDVRFNSLGEPPGMDLYVSERQTFAGDTFFVVRTTADPGALAASVGAAVRDVDSEQSIFDVMPWAERANATVWQQRVAATLLIALALIATAQAAVGVYGVLAFAVAERRREFGVRLALGATRTDVLRQVLRQGMIPVASGIALGVLAAVAAARAVSSLLFEMPAIDPLVFGGTVVLLAVIALVACVVPARRATQADPLESLRQG
jgi:putative ABC transport system permease protein